jgi:hypothetical protein
MGVFSRLKVRLNLLLHPLMSPSESHVTPVKLEARNRTVEVRSSQLR